MKLYIGIDNGLDGGVAAVQDSGTIRDLFPLPTLKLGKGRAADPEQLHRWLALRRDEYEGRLIVAVERATKHSAGTLALCSTWFTYGHIIAVLRLAGVRFHEITSPAAWQKTFWARPKMAAGQKFDTKAAALNAAKSLFPAEKFLASERCSKPHDGMVDAALIAEYARRMNL